MPENTIYTDVFVLKLNNIQASEVQQDVKKDLPIWSLRITAWDDSDNNGKSQVSLNII